jgi:RNA polymerase sigma-70 factor (ECF subfamily)
VLARIRTGDPEAFEQLFTAHYEGMCALAYTFVRSREGAEDIVANVFRSLWMRRLEWEPRGPARTYLLTATRNEAINLLRRLRRERGLEARALSEDLAPALGAPVASPDSAILTREVTEAIERASARLPPRCREVFFLRWREGLRHREIADRLGIAIKTVEMQMTRALKAIRDQLHEHR